MKTITKYIADDGKEFTSEKECLTHEYFVQEVSKICAKFIQGASLWECLKEAQTLEFQGQRLYLEDFSKEEDILREIDTNFKFYIPHWQCAEKPGYGLHRIEYEGYSLKFFIFGDAGSWSGPYGGYCNFQDTLRYAKNTIKTFSKKQM